MKLARYMITDRHLAGVGSASPVPEFIQLREKDIGGRELCGLALNLMNLRPLGTKVIINSRLDVALAVGADGVHLPADSPAIALLRPLCPHGFLIGVSCHTINEVRVARRDGADYCLFGPVFEPLSKVDTRPTHGLEGLKAAVQAASIPVFALGGITERHADACAQAGAAGIAGISMFR